MRQEGESAPLLRDNEGRAGVQAGNAEAKDDGFPYKQLGVLAICRVAEPIAFVSISAYSFVMVQEIKGDKDASFYSGLLISAFALAEASTAMFWGVLSDRYGRKPIILVALAGTALSSLLFGFSKNYWLALFARVVGGLLNGNVAVMQTMVAEMIKKPEHEPRAYSLQPFMWSLGSFAGSSLGGFTAKPAESYPKYFSKDGLFGKFPYLLPNLIAVGIIVVAMVQAWFLLEETNELLKSKNNKPPRNEQEEAVDDITPLRNEGDPLQRTISRNRRESGGSFASASLPLPIDPVFNLRRPSFGSVGSSRLTASKGSPVQMDEIEEVQPENGSTNTTSMKAFTKEVNLWIVALIFLCYQQMAFGAILPIYMLDEPRQPSQQLDLLGGLGLTLPEVGTRLAVNSISSLIIQGLILPIYVEKLGLWWSVVSLTVISPPIYLAAPFISLLPRPDLWIYVLMTLQGFTTIIAYPVLLILLKNATPSLLVLGRVNGLAMSASSGARTISPPIVGLLYSALGSAAAWWSCAVVAVVAIVELFLIKRPQDNDRKILRTASVSA